MKTVAPKPVILCIGTPRVEGDSLGPRVGDLLVEKYNVDAYVYGRTASPVTGVNCRAYLRHVKTRHARSLVIAVDACLGKETDVGKIKYATEGLRAGSAIGKKLGTFGDVSFLGVVATYGEDNLATLSAVRKEDVAVLSAKIAEKIQNLMENLRLTYIF